MTDTRWQIPYAGYLEAVEVCVLGAPVQIEIQIWDIVDLTTSDMTLMFTYNFIGDVYVYCMIITYYLVTC